MSTGTVVRIADQLGHDTKSLVCAMNSRANTTLGIDEQSGQIATA